MKKAFIVGINYAGTGSDLRGCINDARNMEKLLTERGFDEIKLCLEQDATTAGILAGLDWLVQGVIPGDVIVFHYSGHGSQFPSSVEADGYEEIICPIDLDWKTKMITDDHLREIFNKVPRGVNTTLILDCCHSGNALDQDEELLVYRGQLETGDEGRYLPPPAEVMAQLSECTHTVEWTASRDVNSSAMLIAAAHSSQTAADAFIDGSFQGAGTASLIKAVRAKHDISYKDLITEMVNSMVVGKFTQRPQLDGFFGLHGEVFAEPWSWAQSAAPAPAPAPGPTPAPAPAPAPAQPTTDKPEGSKAGMISVAIFVLAIVLYVVFK